VQAYSQPVEDLSGSWVAQPGLLLNLRWAGERIFEKALDRFRAGGRKTFPCSAKRALRGKAFRPHKHEN